MGMSFSACMGASLLGDVAPQLVDFLPQLEVILKSGGLLGGVAQQRGGVEGGHHQGAALVKKDAVLLGDFQIRLNQLLPGNAAQAHQDFRPQQRELVAQVADAGLLLLGQGGPGCGAACT